MCPRRLVCTNGGNLFTAHFLGSPARPATRIHSAMSDPAPRCSDKAASMLVCLLFKSATSATSLRIDQRAVVNCTPSRTDKPCRDRQAR